MKTKFSLLGCVLVMAAVLAVWSAPAQATTLNFNNEYYISSSTVFHNLFGPATAGYGSAGIYQETNTATPTVSKPASSGAPGEFVQNTTPNASQGISLNGWGGSYSNGTPLANNVYNLGNPINGPIYFQYKTGMSAGLGAFNTGTTTAFTLNDIHFRGSTANANLTFTLEGFLGSTLKDTAVLHVTGNTFQDFLLNWQGVNTVEIVSTVSHPVNWGSGTLYLGAMRINEAVPVPLPPSALLLGTGLLGLVGLGWRRRKDEAVS